MSDIRCAVCGQSSQDNVYRLHRSREDRDLVTYTCVGACADLYDDAQASIKMIQQDALAIQTTPVTQPSKPWHRGNRGWR